jgi:hypothetical protein
LEVNKLYQEQELMTNLYSKIKNNEKFFQILEGLLSTDNLKYRKIILDILSHLGHNYFYFKLILDKLESADILIQKNNITQSLVYLNYSNCGNSF